MTNEKTNQNVKAKQNAVALGETCVNSEYATNHVTKEISEGLDMNYDTLGKCVGCDGAQAGCEEFGTLGMLIRKDYRRDYKL